MLLYHSAENSRTTTDVHYNQITTRVVFIEREAIREKIDPLAWDAIQITD